MFAVMKSVCDYVGLVSKKTAMNTVVIMNVSIANVSKKLHLYVTDVPIFLPVSIRTISIMPEKLMQTIEELSSNPVLA